MELTMTRESSIIDKNDFTTLLNENFLELMILDNEASLYRAYQEAVCLEEHNYQGLVQINEGFKDSISNWLTKLKNAVVKVFNSIFARVNELFGNAEGFLKDNEKIIKQKTPLNQNITMPKYDIKALYNLKANLNSKSIEDIIKAEKGQLVGDFIRALNSELNKQILDPNSTDETKLLSVASEAMKKMVCGEKDETINAQKLNMTDIYNFCLSFPEIKKQLKTDKNEIDKLCVEIQNKIEAEYNSTEPEQTETNNGGNGTDNKETKTESTYVSILGTYITEDISFNSGSSNSDGTKNTATSNVVNGTISGASVTNASKDVQGVAALGQAKSNVSLFFRWNTNILTTKSSISCQMFSDYIKLLRWHVSNFTNKEKQHTDKAEQSADATQNSEKVEEIKMSED